MTRGELPVADEVGELVQDEPGIRDRPGIPGMTRKRKPTMEDPDVPPLRSPSQARTRLAEWLLIVDKPPDDQAKHLKLDRYARFDSPARLEKAAAAFDAAFSSEGFESQDAFVIPVAGTLLDALRVAQRCMSAWDHFLTERGLLADRDSVIEKGS